MDNSCYLLSFMFSVFLFFGLQARILVSVLLCFYLKYSVCRQNKHVWLFYFWKSWNKNMNDANEGKDIWCFFSFSETINFGGQLQLKPSKRLLFKRRGRSWWDSISMGMIPQAISLFLLNFIKKTEENDHLFYFPISSLF